MGATRREFVKGIAGAAVAGGFVCAKLKSARADEAPQSGENLVATCGLYCGACPIYLDTQNKSDQKTSAFLQQLGSKQTGAKRENFQCDGCLGKGKLLPTNCAIRSCAEGKGIARCSDCSQFPCPRITDFNNNHGKLLHHCEVLANLRGLREAGIQSWARSEQERWSCPQCRNRLSWYDKACSKCGAKRPDRLFSLEGA